MTTCSPFRTVRLLLLCELIGGAVDSVEVEENEGKALLLAVGACSCDFGVGDGEAFALGGGIATAVTGRCCEDVGLEWYSRSSAAPSMTGIDNRLVGVCWEVRLLFGVPSPLGCCFLGLLLGASKEWESLNWLLWRDRLGRDGCVCHCCFFLVGEDAGFRCVVASFASLAALAA